MYGYSNNNIIELYKSNDTGLTKQHVLEMRNGNSIQKDENKYGGFFYFLHHFGPSIAGAYMIYIIWIVLKIIIFLYHTTYFTYFQVRRNLTRNNNAQYCFLIYAQYQMKHLAD